MGAAALPVGLIGGQVASGLLSPAPESLGSFADDSSIDPARFLQQARGFLDNLLQQGISDTQTPVELPTPDLSLPSFSGGGLPMPIGTTPKRAPLSFNPASRQAMSRTSSPEQGGTSSFFSQRPPSSRLPPIDARARSAASLLLQTAQGGA